MENSISHLKVRLVNSIAVKLNVENTRSRLVYAEVITTREQILKTIASYLINADVWLHIYNFPSQISLPHQRILVKV